MFCYKCGSELEKGDTVCPNCHSKAEETKKFKFNDYLSWKWCGDVKEADIEINLKLYTLLLIIRVISLMANVDYETKGFLSIVFYFIGVLIGNAVVLTIILAILSTIIEAIINNVPAFKTMYQNKYKQKALNYERKMLIPLNFRIKEKIFVENKFTKDERQALDRLDFNNKVLESCKEWADIKNSHTLKEYQERAYQKISEMIKQDIKDREEMGILIQKAEELRAFPNPEKRYSQELIAKFEDFFAEFPRDNINTAKKGDMIHKFALLQKNYETENQEIADENEIIYADIQELRNKLQAITQDKKYSNDFFDYAKESENKLDIEIEKLDKTLAEIDSMITGTFSDSIKQLEASVAEEEKTAKEVSGLETLIRQTINKKASDKRNDYSNAFENKFANMQTILDRLPNIHKQSLFDIKAELKDLQNTVNSVIADMNKELSEMEERFKIKENYRSDLERLYNDIENVLQDDIEIVKNSSEYAEIRRKIDQFTDIHYEDAEAEYHKLENEISELKANIQQEILEILEEKRIAKIKQIQLLAETAKSIPDVLQSFSDNAEIDQTLLKKIIDETEPLISATDEFVSRRA